MKLMRLEPRSWLDPIESTEQIQQEMNRLFDFAFPALSRLGQGWMASSRPAFDLYQDKEKYVIRAELPGMKKEEISIEFVNGTLVISGARKVEEKQGKTVRETSETYFNRAVDLPDDIDRDKIEARYEDGVLTVTIPKKEEAKPKQIEIKVD